MGDKIQSLCAKVHSKVFLNQAQGFRSRSDFLLVLLSLCHNQPLPRLSKNAQCNETQWGNLVQKRPLEDAYLRYLNLTNTDCWSLIWTSDKPWNVVLYRTRTVDFATHHLKHIRNWSLEHLDSRITYRVYHINTAASIPAWDLWCMLCPPSLSPCFQSAS